MHAANWQQVTMSSHMHTNMYASDERAREMELAGSERQMGCSPFGRMISKVIKKCNGRKRWRKEKLDYAMAYPHAQTCYVRPTASTVAYNTTAHPPNTHAIPPPQPPKVYGPFGPTAAAPPGAAGGKPRKRKKKSKNVRFNTAAGPVYPGSAPPLNVDAYHHPSAAATSGDAAYGDQRHHHHAAASHGYSPVPHGQGYGYGQYAPSPLTRWEMLGAAGTPRRHEYFSGEYRWCYPTPVREGIYSMATDANRLTAIFSEENPNACTIV